MRIKSILQAIVESLGIRPIPITPAITGTARREPPWSRAMPPTVVPWFIAIVLPGWMHSARTLGRMGEWCLRFTPRVHVEPWDPADAAPPLVLLDASGCLRVNGGARRLESRISRGLARRGIAHAVGSAGASGPAVVQAMGAAMGAPHAHIDALPIECLRLPPATCTALHEVNVTRIGELAAIARAALADRYGSVPGERLAMAAGRLPWPFRAIVPPSPVVGEFVFASPCAQREAVDRACIHAVESLCAALDARGRGVRALSVRVERARLAPISGTMHFGAPTRDPQHLWRLLAPRIERMHLGDHERGEGIERIELTAVRLGRCAGGTPFLGGLVADASAASAADGPAAGNDHRAATERAVGELVDQLRARLGEGRVMSAEP
jgi:protein ImuB